MRKLLFYLIFLLIMYSGKGFAQTFQSSVYNQNINKEQDIEVYPNPAKDYLYLKTSNPNIKIKSIIFYSILGNIVADMPINASYSEIKVDKLKPGRYLMKYILNDNSQKIIQIIKQ